MPEVFEIDINIFREITIFLLEKRIIFHPSISPNGVPDFSQYHGKKYNLIIDRNILTKLIKFVTDGELKDPYFRKIISSLMFWVNINNIGIVSSFALMEYSYGKQNSLEANLENKIFLEIFKSYDPQIWLNVAVDKEIKIPKIVSKNRLDANFYIESDHFKMHYLEMLKLAQLYFNTELSSIKKLEIFTQWVVKNLIICRYTTFYATLLLFGKSRIFNNINPTNFDLIHQKCKNQAWDLTYLSEWSTLHYYEDNADTIYLFATADNELKQIFIMSHKESIDTYFEIFGREITRQIFEKLNPIYRERRMPNLDMNVINKLINKEKEILKEKLIVKI